MPNEERFATPLKGYIFSLRDVTKFNLDFSQSQDISWCTHWTDEICDQGFGCVGTSYCSTSNNQVRKRLPLLRAFSRVGCTIQNILAPICREIWNLDVWVDEADLAGCWDYNPILKLIQLLKIQDCITYFAIYFGDKNIYLRWRTRS